MAIVCPNCATSYNIDAQKLGEGRSVRCARCKEVWFAQPLPQLAMAGEVEWDETPAPAAPTAFESPDIRDIESPPLAAGMPDGEEMPSTGSDLVPVPPQDAPIIDATLSRASRSPRRAGQRAKKQAAFGLPTAVAAMAALIAALMVWRIDVVKLLPQTAILYKTVGLPVNLRGLSFRDVTLSHETVDGKPVLVIEGAIVDDLKRPLEVPKLRFIVRDEKGSAIYAWNANAEQTVIEPGERVAFRSRLAAPPEETRAIDVRFFHRRDLAGAT